MGFFQPNNLFGRIDWDTKREITFDAWSEPITKQEMYWLPMMFIFAFLMIMWGAANTPELTNVAFYYAIFLIMFTVVQFYVTKNPNNPVFSSVHFGEIEEMGSSVLYALLIVFITMIFSGVSGQLPGLITYNVFSSVPFMDFLYTVVLIPFVECGFFVAFLVPFLAEKLGIVPAIIVSTLFFGLFHAFAYGGNAVWITNACMFQMISAVAVLKTRSYAGPYFAHLIMNWIGWMGMQTYMG